MFDSGWIDEVRTLLDQGIKRDGPGMGCIGYREILKHLDGELSSDELVERTIISTRQYAKRQKNWFRSEAVHWIEPSLTTEDVIACFENIGLWSD